MDSPNPPAAVFEIVTDGPEPVVTVVGELDLANAPQLTTVLDDALASAELVHVDLSEVSFADSTALGALVAAHERAVSAGKLLCVSAVSDIVDALFHVAGLSDELRC